MFSKNSIACFVEQTTKFFENSIGMYLTGSFFNISKIFYHLQKSLDFGQSKEGNTAIPIYLYPNDYKLEVVNIPQL
jgi:hypothetical protein